MDKERRNQFPSRVFKRLRVMMRCVVTSWGGVGDRAWGDGITSAHGKK